MPARKLNVVKFRQGTLRKSRLNTRAPAPHPGAPGTPKGLTARSRRAWRELSRSLLEMGIFTPHDGLALRLLAETFDEYIAADLMVREHGLTYSTTTENGSVMYRARPEVAIRADAQRRLFRIAQAFGLTPEARDKVSKVLAENEDPGARYLG